MAFEDNASGDGASVTTPAPDPKSAIPASAGDTSNMPVGDLQPPPATAPSQPPLQLQPSPAAPSRSFMGALAHALIGSTLSVATHGLKAIAGPQSPDSYTTDETGKMTPNFSRTDSSRDRIARIALHALEGLAAGSQVPQQKSGAASFAAGIGAGAAGEMQQATQADLLKRQQAKEGFDREQAAIANRAVFAMHNAQMANYWLDALKKQNDLDPDRATNMAIKQTIDDLVAENPHSPITAELLTEPEARARRDSQTSGEAHTPDSHPVGNSVWLPAGNVPIRDADGNYIHNADGSYKTVGQVIVVTGAPGGKFKAPAAWVNEVQKYKSIMGGSGYDGLKPDQDISLTSFARINTMLTAAKKKVSDETPQVGHDKDGKQILIYPLRARLGLENSTQPVPEGAQFNVENKPAKEAADIAEKGALTDKAKADTAKTNEETKQLKEWDTGGPNGSGRIDVFGNPVGAPGMDRKEYVKRVDTYTKDYSKDLNQLDAARSQLKDIITNAEKNKKLPGADAVVGIFDAIGISSAPLKGRGFRINNSVVSEHVEGTRNAWQNMALKLSRLTPEGTGQIVSLDQLKDYERIMDAARRDAYVGAANDAVNRGIGIQKVPRGNGAAIDDNTMDIFLTLAKGDPKAASAIARQYGWAPPTASR